MQDLSARTGTLPYASELFGIYQPLLGWKSKLIAARYDQARARAQTKVASAVLNTLRSTLSIRSEGERELPAARWMATPFHVDDLKPTPIGNTLRPMVVASIDCGVARLLADKLGNKPPADWRTVVTEAQMSALLDRMQRILNDHDDLARHTALSAYVDSFVAAAGETMERQRMLRGLFEKEARIAGYLVFLAEHTPQLLTGLFFAGPKTDALKLMSLADPLLSFGDRQYQAILSPVGIIHLYREYFYEFDSFLGPPVGHVWLSPGGTVELIEVNTRKVFTERSVEQMSEVTQRSESEQTRQDDIAGAVKEENRGNVKFGFTNTASYTAPVFQDTATASLSMENAKTSSRETTYKHMRQQSEKLSSEIKRNFKTTFKTSTEVTDTTSKRYVISNTGPRLVNYELRRKMRKVGVQVQDIGVQLCWHTFVDDPGALLGLSKLVHIGEMPQMADLVQPDAPVDPGVQTADMTIPIPFVGLDTDDKDNAYTNGSETEVGALFDETEHIRWQFPFKASPCKSPGCTLTAVAVEAVGFDAQVSAPADKIKSAPGSSQGEFQVDVNYVNWNGNDQFQVKVTLTWSPDEAAITKVNAEYGSKLQTYTEERARRYKEAFLKSSRERITLASQIGKRPAEALREEERTLVYRRLISQLMKVGAGDSKHVTSELIRSIFDIDKMLYFVAPEWWVPRLHRSTQSLGEPMKPPPLPGNPPAPAPAKPAAASGLFKSAVKLNSVIAQAGLADADAVPPIPAPIPRANQVDWGGAAEVGRDNYFITEDSRPAPLGSSLGWLLQLDGDDLRNALLNAPWVKAVIPIRIGKEKEAMHWLQQAHVEGDDGLDAAYVPAPEDPPELQKAGLTVKDALEILIAGIHEFDQRARSAVIANPADPEDASNHFAGSLPTEAVFENGFYPLKGGVRFDQSSTEQVVFSQWMEILPTDQVAALEVEYDPKTLQAKVVPPAAAGG